MHGAYKPWGSGTLLYAMQHLALGLVTSVFACGLMFKVGALRIGELEHVTTEYVLAITCFVFILMWIVTVVTSLVMAARRKQVVASTNVVANVSAWGDAVVKVESPVLIDVATAASIHARD